MQKYHIWSIFQRNTVKFDWICCLSPYLINLNLYILFIEYIYKHFRKETLLNMLQSLAYPHNSSNHRINSLNNFEKLTEM